MLTIAGGIVLAVIFLIVGFFVLVIGVSLAGRAISKLAEGMQSIGGQMRDSKTMSPFVLFAILCMICVSVCALVFWIRGY